MTHQNPVPLTQSLAAFIAAHQELRGALARYHALAGPKAEPDDAQTTRPGAGDAAPPVRATRRRLEIVVSKTGDETKFEVQ